MHPEAGDGLGSGDLDDGSVGSSLAEWRLPSTRDPPPPGREALTGLTPLRSAICNWLMPVEPGVRARTGAYPAVRYLFHITGLVLTLQRERWLAAADRGRREAARRQVQILDPELAGALRPAGAMEPGAGVRIRHPGHGGRVRGHHGPPQRGRHCVESGTPRQEGLAAHA